MKVRTEFFSDTAHQYGWKRFFGKIVEEELVKDSNKFFSSNVYGIDASLRIFGAVRQFFYGKKAVIIPDFFWQKSKKNLKMGDLMDILSHRGGAVFSILCFFFFHIESSGPD